MPAVRSGNASIHYEAVGAGPALVFAHGAGGNAMSWWQQVPHFARRHRVIAFDHRGYGRSTCPVADLDPSQFVADLAAVLDAEKIERATLVGQSMGGFTVLPFTLAHPGRVSALVLCGTPGGVRTERIARDMAEIPRRTAERGFAGMVVGPGFSAREPARAFLYEQINSLNPPETLAAIVPRLASVRVDDQAVAALDIPVLVVGGTDDAFFSPDGLGEVAAKFRRGRFVELRDAGHSTYFEVPDAFNAMLESFLLQVARE
jgi:3-oxoadipate enol-lactonase